MSVIFLAGVHGVGKGFLGAPVASSMGVAHLTASQLIREEKGQATWGLDKKTSDLDDNQLALIRAVAQRRLTHPSILLDGHFVLRDAQGVLTPLATSVFKELHFERLAGQSDHLVIWPGGSSVFEQPPVLTPVGCYPDRKSSCQFPK